ncbi:MAG: hypothetical protein M3Y07_19205 [Acidobacteriota bacterium]|nr:hypothetical protein [Acidobacteriota bacterium]
MADQKDTDLHKPDSGFPLNGSWLRLLVLGLVALGSMFGKSTKLIEFGWDEPDSAFLRKHSAKMDRTPFDGCVFHINSFTWEVWGKRAFTMPEVQAAVEDLKALSFHKLRHNFLRFNVTPGDLDWFDDFSAVINNANLAAKVAKSGPCDGILFDIEQYKNPLFEYSRQRDATRKSWPEYAAQAKLRGYEVMRAFQSGFPNLKVFLTYGYDLPWEQSQKGKVPLSQTDYGLLAPFLDGMLAAVKGKTRIIDGFEFAYSCKEPACIRDGYQEMKRGVLPLVSEKKKYRKAFSFSFGIWVDANWRQAGWHPADLTANFHTPGQFETVVKTALETADEYVWIYSENPKWWTEPSGESAGMPPAFQTALDRARAIGSR